MTERRNYRKVYQRIWRNPEFREMPPAEKVMTQYLLTGPQTNRIGLFYLSIAAGAEDMNIAPETFRAVLGRVCEAFGWSYDLRVSVVWIPSWWRWNPVENPKNLKGYLTDLSDVPSTPLIDRFLDNREAIEPDMHVLLDRWRSPIRVTESVTERPKIADRSLTDHRPIGDGSVTDQRPITDRSTETETETETETQTRARGAAAAAPDERKPLKPRPKRFGRITLHHWQQLELVERLGPMAADFGLDEWVFNLSALADQKRLAFTDRDELWEWVQTELDAEVRRRGLTVASKGSASQPATTRDPNYPVPDAEETKRRITIPADFKPAKGSLIDAARDAMVARGLDPSVLDRKVLS